MTPEIITALITLATIVVTALGVIVKAVTNRLVKDLEHNTLLTSQAHALVNGNFRDTVEQLAATRNQNIGLKVALRERGDMLAYILARHPEVENTIQTYQETRARYISSKEEEAYLQQLLTQAGEDPVN